ncbi:transcriptional regulator GcvA [Undibacterium sp.]|jgi:LysR family glycine cleavage system transcriptional activator|uniref:transcriptional regulator GcvA n=1 Tax=Undibacterium sp. TaxID=1914977 RepID=UPI002CED5680|nr:transcriptional regulator GcvA [Undibacterium sp.]HTD03241.1 transcriptional regulator GcvA [Undibacterium sp.]
MPTKLPPLHALHCFECVSRHLSVKHAAEEMHVTPAAISQQISKLEQLLGVLLFVRGARKLALSEAGLSYFLGIRTAFRQIEEATGRLASWAGQPVITISCTTVFAMQYLLPRLPRFHALHPAIDVRVSTTHRLVDFAHDGVDLAVRHGLGKYPGLISELLMDDPLYPVCSPRLLSARKSLKSADMLRDYTLLHDERKDDWKLWLQAAAAGNVDGTQGPIFTDFNAAIEAAIAGHGIALARKSLVGAQLADGRLVMPLNASIKSAIAYYLVYPAEIDLRREVQLFRAWLLGEIKKPE